MSKIIKKVVVAFVFAICAIALVGCQMGGGSGNGGTNNGGNNGGSQTGATVAKIPVNLQGTYYGDDVVVVVYESKVTITDPSGKTLEYTIYTEDGKYYVEEDGNKNYCTFGDGTVTNSHGTFAKNGSQGGNGGNGGDNPGGDTNTNDILAKLRRLSGISDLRLPEGGSVRAEDINETGLVGYGVLVSGASETFASYKTYFDAKVKAAGFEETLEGFTKVLEDGSMLGIALSQDKDGSIQIAVIQASEVITDEIPVATFQAQFKEATGIDLVFPDYVTGVVVPVF